MKKGACPLVLTLFTLVNLCVIGISSAQQAPSIATQPASQTVLLGTNASFTVDARGQKPLLYQWLIGTNALSGATNTTLDLTNVQYTDAGSYSVVVTNSVGSITSAPAVLTVNGPPLIIGPPVAQTLGDGSDAAFMVQALGTAPLSYLWFSNGVALAAQTNSTLLRTNVQLADNGHSYAVRVSNSFGSVTSAPVLLKVHITLQIIQQQGCNGTVHPGNSVGFTIIGRAQPTVSVAWCLGSCMATVASTDSNYYFTNTQTFTAPATPGRYLVSALIANSYGSLSTFFVMDVASPLSSAAALSPDAVLGDFTGCGVSTPLILSAGLPGVFSGTASSSGTLNTSQTTPCGTYDSFSATRWFQVVANSGGLATLTTEGTGLDTTLAIFLNPIDNPGFLRYVGCTNDISSNNKQSRLQFIAQPYNEYWLAVGGLGSSSLKLSYGFEPRLASVARRLDGTAEVRSAAIVPIPHTLQGSVDLRSWSNLMTTNVFPNGILDFIDLNARGLNRRFYRVVPGP